VKHRYCVYRRCMCFVSNKRVIQNLMSRLTNTTRDHKKNSNTMVAQQTMNRPSYAVKIIIGMIAVSALIAVNFGSSEVR
jgi:hypothetical protein